MNIKKIIAVLTGLTACLTLASCTISGGATNEEMFRRISDTLTTMATGSAGA